MQQNNLHVPITPRTIARLPMIKIRHVGYCFSSVASVSSGGGDPPCSSSGIVSCCATGVPAKARFRGGRRLAALAGRRLSPVRRLVALRRLVVDRRFEVSRRLAGVRFFRDEREVAARFLRFAICCLQDWAPVTTLPKTVFSQNGRFEAFRPPEPHPPLGNLCGGADNAPV